MRNRAVLFATLVMLALLPAAGADDPAASAAIDPKADALLKQMGKQLASASRFSFSSYSTVDQSLDNGQKVQVARNQKIAVRRPDGVSAIVSGDLEDLKFWYDGTKVTLLNVRNNSYGVTDAPATIDATFDMLAQKHGLAIPLADLLFNDPYKTLMAHVHSASYLGIGYVLETKCHHLAFRQENVDWQIWIEDGERALPRKIVITYKEIAGHPQYVSLLSDWNLKAATPDKEFSATLPADARKVEFGPTRAAPGKKE